MKEGRFAPIAILLLSHFLICFMLFRILSTDRGIIVPILKNVLHLINCSMRSMQSWLKSHKTKKLQLTQPFPTSSLQRHLASDTNSVWRAISSDLPEYITAMCVVSVLRGSITIVHGSERALARGTTSTATQLLRFFYMLLVFLSIAIVDILWMCSVILG